MDIEQLVSTRVVDPFGGALGASAVHVAGAHDLHAQELELV